MDQVPVIPIAIPNAPIPIQNRRTKPIPKPIPNVRNGPPYQIPGYGYHPGHATIGSPVHQPRVVRRDVNHIGARGLDDDRRALRRYGLLRGAPPGCRIPAPAVASPARRPSHPLAGCSTRRPGTMSRKDSCPYFQGRMGMGQRLDARVPIMLVHTWANASPFISGCA